MCAIRSLELKSLVPRSHESIRDCEIWKCLRNTTFVHTCFKHVAYKMLISSGNETDNHSGDSKTMFIRTNWQALLEYTVDCDELRILI